MEVMADKSAERQPSGYAYRYHSLFGGTEIRFNHGESVNGSEPIESIPYFFGAPEEFERGRLSGLVEAARGKFRKKPVVIEAVQWTGKNLQDIHEFMDTVVVHWNPLLGDGGALFIPTLEGEMQANCGDWIIRGVKGEFYPCRPDIFAATYEPIENEAPAKEGR